MQHLRNKCRVSAYVVSINAAFGNASGAWFKPGWHALSTRRAWVCGRHALRVLRACHLKRAFLDHAASGERDCWLRFNAGAVAAAEISPTKIEARLIRDGELRRQFLIEVDSQSGPIVRV